VLLVCFVFTSNTLGGRVEKPNELAGASLQEFSANGLLEHGVLQRYLRPAPWLSLRVLAVPLSLLQDTYKYSCECRCCDRHLTDQEKMLQLDLARRKDLAQALVTTTLLEHCADSLCPVRWC